MSSLEGKTIVIVGGAQGIGQATAELCVERGARVVIADVNEEAGTRLATTLNATFYAVNVADESSVRGLFEHINRQHGELDVLIQTAGVLPGAYHSVEEFD